MELEFGVCQKNIGKIDTSKKNTMLVFIVTDRNDQIIGAYSTIEAAVAAVREHPGAELQHLHLDGDDSLSPDPQLFNPPR